MCGTFLLLIFRCLTKSSFLNEFQQFEKLSNFWKSMVFQGYYEVECLNFEE